MKKVVALALALVMALGVMAVSVFAADPVINTVELEAGKLDTIEPGQTGTSKIFVNQTEQDKNTPCTFETKIVKGKDVIDSVKVEMNDDTGYYVLKVKAKSNLTLTTEEEYTIRLTVGTKTASDEKSIEFSGVVAYESEKVSEDNAAVTVDNNDPYIIKFTKAVKNIKVTYRDENGDTAAQFTVKNVGATTQVFHFSTDAVKEIEKANPKAETRYLDFKGTEYDIAGELVIYADSEEYLYTIGANNKLTLVDAEKYYDEDLEAYVFDETATLNAYVISDIELANASTGTSTPSTDNPGTGSSDMVGVAVALAVVSMVAAGAVALKK